MQQPISTEAPKLRNQWLSSNDAKRFLHCSDCHLMHLRIEGKLTFKKKGNAFFYDATCLGDALAAIRRNKDI